jgi:hypothetical protein
MHFSSSSSSSSSSSDLSFGRRRMHQESPWSDCSGSQSLQFNQIRPLSGFDSHSNRVANSLPISSSPASRPDRHSLLLTHMMVVVAVLAEEQQPKGSE